MEWFLEKNAVCLIFRKSHGASLDQSSHLKSPNMSTEIARRINYVLFAASALLLVTFGYAFEYVASNAPLEMPQQARKCRC